MENRDNNSNKTDPQLLSTVFFGLASFGPDKNGVVKLRPLWNRIIICFFSLTAILWIGKTVAFYSFFKYKREFAQVSMVDAFIFPLNRKSLTEKFGESQIKMALDDLKAGEYRDALFLLRVGLSRSPDNRDGRLALAGIYRAMRNDDMTVETLRNGLQFHANDGLFVKTYLQTLLAFRRDEEIREYAKAKLTTPSNPLTVTEQISAYVAAQVAEANGQFTTAIDYLTRYKLTETAEGCILLSKCKWACGDKNGAISLLQSFSLRHPEIPSDLLYQTLCDNLHSLGRDKEALSCALNFSSVAPKSFNARIILIRSYHYVGNTEREKQEIANYLREFSDKSDALLILSDYSIQTGNIRTAKEAYYAAAEQGYNMGIFAMLMIEAHLTNNNAQLVLDYCETIQNENPFWLQRYDGQFSFLKASAARMLNKNDVANLYLGRVLDSTVLKSSDMLSMGNRLRSLKLDADALKIYEKARVLDPRNGEILSGILSIDLDNNLDTDFVANVDALLALRRPDYELLRRARERLTSDHFIFNLKRDEVLAKLDLAIDETNQLKR